VLVLQPAANKVGIEAMGQRHTGYRSARLLTGQDYLTLEIPAASE